MSAPARSFASPKTQVVSTVRDGEAEIDGGSLKRMKNWIDEIWALKPEGKLEMTEEQRASDKAFVAYATRKMALRKQRCAKLEQRKINVKNLTFDAIPAELRTHCQTVDTEPWPANLLTPAMTAPARDWLLHHYRLLDISRDELFRRLQEEQKRRDEEKNQAKLKAEREAALAAQA